MASFKFTSEEKQVIAHALKDRSKRLWLLASVIPLEQSGIELKPEDIKMITALIEGDAPQLAERMREHPDLREPRPTVDQRFMSLAKEAARSWGTCPRARVGAVLAHGSRFISIGFNGAPSGQPHCDDVGCLMVNGHCRRARHAERNAIALGGLNAVPLVGSLWAHECTLYVSHFPCWDCAQEIVQAGLGRVVYEYEYRMDMDALRLLLSACEVQRFEGGKAVAVGVLKAEVIK